MAGMQALPRRFYERPTLAVARELLGCVLVRRYRGQILSGYITETEAYIGKEDPASHAFRGMTPRTAVMFGEAGHVYVYFVYGMYWCMNVVTESKGVAAAVLLRGLWPKEGAQSMARRRFGTITLTQAQKKNLANGPGKLCTALAIDKTLNGVDFLDSKLAIIPGKKIPESAVQTSGRIGIRAATDYPWRFYIAEPEKFFS